MVEGVLNPIRFRDTYIGAGDTGLVLPLLAGLVRYFTPVAVTWYM
jgi:hypothetical protein